MDIICQGDLVISLKGRDKNNTFLVIAGEGDYVYIADGKIRKVKSLKMKKKKHLKKILSAGLKGLAEKIYNGQSVGDKSLRQQISTVNKKIQEE